MRMVEDVPRSIRTGGRAGRSGGQRARSVVAAALLLSWLVIPAAPVAAQAGQTAQTAQTVQTGQTYEDGLRAHKSGAVERAVEIWQKLADEGDVVSQHSLGRLYANGEGPIKRDYTAAARLFRQSAAQGYPQAQNDLAVLYALGRGVPKDPERAAKLWAESAQAGVPMAQYNLGLIYFQGRGVEKDPEVAAKWISRAAATGLANAQFALGHMNRLGIAMAKDEGRALAWYQRAAAQGHDQAAAQAKEMEAAGIEAIALKIEASSAPANPAAAGTAPGAVEQGSAETAGAEAAAVAAVAPAASSAGAFMVWIGSMGSRDGAERLWREVSAKHAAALAGTNPLIVEVDLGDRGTFYRLHAEPLASRDAAKSVCARLRQAQPDAFCRVVSG